MDGPLTALTLVAALGCGLNAGVFFAFSSFVLKALGRLQPAAGIAAMQAINVAAVSFAFMFALFGTAALCLVLAAWALADLGESHAGLLLAGSALYLAGVIGVTVAYNVPRNDALAELEPSSPDAARHWLRYLSQWSAGNHARTAAGLAAAAAFAAAL